MDKTAIIVGSTGLVGSSLTKQIQHHGSFSKVYLLVREKTKRSFTEKIEEVEVDFENESTFPSIENADTVFCCLGTTIKKAGSQENFKKVDLEFVIRIASFYQQLGAKRFLVISAVAADKNSKIFYNRVKGEMEEELIALDYSRTLIFRPAMLGGKRNEFRFGEWFGSIILKSIQWLFIGRMKRYKIISAEKVAKSMLLHSQNNKEKVLIVESEEIQKA